MELFIEIFQVVLGTRVSLSRNPTDKEWDELFDMSQKQAVAGVIFSALDKLSVHGQKPPSPLIYKWIGVSEQIKQRNILLNQKCVDLTGLFSDSGFDSCILKGQGNALMYPEPLLRTSGDIDIWVKGKRDKIIAFCQSKVEACEISYHHIQFPIWKDVQVEVHFMPSYTKIPRLRKRYHAYFDNFQRVEIDNRGLFPEGTKIYVPDKKVNLVFQMSHMARHFFFEGIGLRQLMDFYYLLLYNDCDRELVVNEIKYLNLDKFAGAVMWVLGTVFGMEDKYMLVPPDERRGKLLLDVILKGGNFGRHNKGVLGWLNKRNTTLSIITRSIKIARLFPEEAFWSPVLWVGGYFSRHKK